MPVRRALLIITALLFLNSSTELHELFRLPLLIDHYRQHRKEDSSVTLISFLKIHYTGNHPDDRDDNEDKQLPFKSGDNIDHTDNPVIIKRDPPARSFTFIKDRLARYNPEDIPDQRCHSIFHPPRLS